MKRDHLFTLGVEEEFQIVDPETRELRPHIQQILSITLDPEFDIPQILKDHGAFYHADPQIWTFATGEKNEIEALTRAFSVYRQTEGGTISHGLATALIDKNGKIDKIWRMA
jgi:protein SCO1